jgi:hypothetical protein
MAHPLRRLRLSLPAARLGVAMNDSVVAIVSAFFIMGITVGIVAVVALSVLRADRLGVPGDPHKYGPHAPGDQPPHTGWRNAGADGHPRWPGDVDNDVNSE